MLAQCNFSEWFHTKATVFLEKRERTESKREVGLAVSVVLVE